ncbi:MAG: glycosyltransferase, partial [Microgenomates group bacterium Gr01-1014_93]
EISITITTKQEQDVIGDLLESIRRSTFKDYEIILVDHNSSDLTREIAKRYTKKIFIKGPERSAQRNFGAKKATGKYLLILDADMQLEEDVLRQSYQLFEKDKEVGAIVIPERSFGQGFWTQFKVFEREFYIDEKDIEAARFFRNELFKKFGGYDESITGPEDWDLPMRMKKSGIKIGRIKSFILHNEGRFSPWRSAKKKFYYASNARNFLTKHPESVLSQGNLLFRPVFFKKWRKLLSNPILSLGMFCMRSIEMAGAGSGIIWSFVKKEK